MSNSLVELSAALQSCVAAAAVQVVAIRAQGQAATSGIIWRDGLIVTAEEALDHEDGVQVLLPDGSMKDASLIGRDPSTDVALLRAETGSATPWKAAATPEVGSLALVIGKGSDSAIAGLALVAEAGPAWQSMNGGRIDARIRLGLALSGRAEGGAVVTPEGALIGMAVTDPRRRTIVIPAATIARAVERLSEHGYVARGYAGIALQPLARRDRLQGALITDVQPESPAAAAGLAVGDLVTTWEGNPVSGPWDVARALGTDSVGQSVTVGFLRGGERRELSVTIGERRLGA